MGDDLEIQFRGGNPKKWHSGKMNIEKFLISDLFLKAGGY
jgi:hypothetical protein